MRWDDERYVRVYTRDTGEWIQWPWETRALLLLILRKVDRAGLLPLGKGALRSLAAVVGMPVEEVTAAIEPLLDDGCVQITDNVLFIPNFTTAQETGTSDKLRKSESRARARAQVLESNDPFPKERRRSQLVTGVTVGHDLSQASQLVTVGHSVLCRTVPNCAGGSDARAREPEHCTPPDVPIQEAPSETKLRQAPTDPEPLTPDDSRIRDAIRNLPKLADLDASDLAQQACAQMLTKGTKLEWILQALRDAADKSQRGELSHVRHGRLVSFIRSAKAPKVDEREQKAGPAYREFAFEPGELERIRKVPRRTPLRSPSATETNFQADPVGVPMAEQQERALALVNGIGRTGGR